MDSVALQIFVRIERYGAWARSDIKLAIPFQHLITWECKDRLYIQSIPIRCPASWGCAELFVRTLDDLVRSCLNPVRNTMEGIIWARRYPRLWFHFEGVKRGIRRRSFARWTLLFVSLNVFLTLLANGTMVAGEDRFRVSLPNPAGGTLEGFGKWSDSHRKGPILCFTAVLLRIW